MTARASKSAITRYKVPDGARLKFFPENFGILYLQAESMLYSTARTLCKDYRGGLWEFYKLSNGGAYAAPLMALDTYPCEWPENYYSGEMSADAIGIVVTLFVYSRLTFANPDNEDYRDKFYWLMDYAEHHEEAEQIFRAID